MLHEFQQQNLNCVFNNSVIAELPAEAETDVIRDSRFWGWKLQMVKPPTFKTIERWRREESHVNMSVFNHNA